MILTIWKTLDKFYMKYPLQFTHVMRWIDKGKCIDKCSTHTYIHKCIYNRYWHPGILQIYQNMLAKKCNNKMTQPPYSNH